MDPATGSAAGHAAAGDESPASWLVRRRLSRVHCLADFRATARRRIPKMVFDFVDGAAGDESAKRENRLALERIKLLPSAPCDVSQRSTRIRMFGAEFAMPVIIAPNGLASASWPNGEQVFARAAARHGIPFVLSNSTSMSPESVTAASPGGAAWFQLYPPPDRETARRWIARVRNCGFVGLEVTVDVAVPGNRLRDARNGFAMPFAWTFGKFIDVATRPGWAMQMLRHGTPRPYLTVQNNDEAKVVATVSDARRHRLSPALSWDMLKWLRDEWRGPLIVKGLMDPGQAKHAVAAGFDGIVVSNHGGRQFDGAPASIDMLPEFVAEVGGGLDLLVDGGFLTGTDILKALALGASAVQFGRGLIYALAAAGEAGVDHALTLLRQEIDNGMAMCGVTDLRQLTPERVRRTGVFAKIESVRPAGYRSDPEGTT